MASLSRDVARVCADAEVMIGFLGRIFLKD